MTSGLSVSDVVNVNLNLAPTAAAGINFGTLVIAGPSDVIDVSQRLRQYSTLPQVATDFGTTAPEYLAAADFFGQIPTPSLLYIGRWAQNATAARLYSETFSASGQVALLAALQAVTSGSMLVTLNGVPYAVTGLAFNTITNLNGAATVLQTALSALVAGTTVTWNSAYGYFIVEDGATGATSIIGYAAPPTAVGSFAYTGQPTVSDIIVVDSISIAYIANGATPSGNQVALGTTVAGTVAATLAFLQTSTNATLTLMTYTAVGNTIYVTSKATGTTGNAYTLAVSGSTPPAKSGANLAGGSGTDVSTTLGFTAAAGASAVAGIAAETPVACAAILLGTGLINNTIYGLTFAPVNYSDITVAQHQAVATFIQGAGMHIYGVTTTDANALSSTSTTDLAAVLAGMTLSRTFCQYSSSSLYAAASLFGRAFTVNFSGNNTTITLMYKQEPGVTPETLTESQAAVLKTKNCNVFVNYNNQTTIIQTGVMCNGYFFDEVQGCDWLGNTIQTNVYNLLYTSPTKIPLTDAGNHQVGTAIEAACLQGVVNGLGAAGLTWSGPPVGQLATGDVLAKGFYVYVPPVSSLTQAQRAARQTVAIQVAFPLAGAVHTVNVLVNVTR